MCVINLKNYTGLEAETSFSGMRLYRYFRITFDKVHSWIMSQNVIGE